MKFITFPSSFSLAPSAILFSNSVSISLTGLLFWCRVGGEELYPRSCSVVFLSPPQRPEEEKRPLLLLL